MKAKTLVLALALALPHAAQAAKISYDCTEQKPDFGPARKVMSLTRLTHGAMPVGAPVRYHLQVAEGGILTFAAPAVAKEDPAEVAFTVRGQQVKGSIPLAAPERSSLQLGRQAFRFACRARD